MPVRRPLRAIDTRNGVYLAPTEGNADPIAVTRQITFLGDRRDAHIKIHSSGVSTLHAALIIDSGVVCIRDLASRTGTFLNGARIIEAMCNDGDTIRIGDCSYRLVDRRAVGSVTIVDGVHPVLIQSNESPDPIEWRRRSFTIGSRPGCDLMAPGGQISGTHALLCRLNGRVFVRDAGSRLGTYLNKLRVRLVEVAPQDTIAIGGLVLRVAPASVSEKSQPTIEPAMPAEPVTLPPPGPEPRRYAADELSPDLLDALFGNPDPAAAADAEPAQAQRETDAVELDSWMSALSQTGAAHPAPQDE